MAVKGRFKVTIRCKHCGERFVLKGRMNNAKIDTGFKQCICSNEKDFIIETKCF
jgi:DNA-directed RNA polymerase subunit RPC12/RpoP